MPWSGSTFSRTNGVNSGADTWEQDRDEPVNILASRHDDHDQDLADGINACLKKDGGNTATADIPMGGFKLTSLGAATTNGHAVRFDQFSFTSWSPTFTPGGTMTYTSQSLSFAEYLQINKLVFYRFSVSGTMGGSLASTVRFSLPVTATSNPVAGSVTILDNSIIIAGSISYATTTAFDIYPQITIRGAQENYTAGTVALTGFGFYEAA